MNFNNNKIQKMLAINSKYNNSTKNELIKITHFINENSNSKVEINSMVNGMKNLNINSINIRSVFNDTWSVILPTSCKFTPLYFTPTYPWTYRMSAKINNYFFGKKPIHNLLTFNINLPIKYQLTGSYFFSNYDTTNYGKLNNKKISLYRIYPSLLPENRLFSNKYIYQPVTTGLNLAYLPLNKYNHLILSGNAWFNDPICDSLLRKYHNIQSYNIMSREIDSVISIFDNKLGFIFNPLSAVYNLKRNFTLGLSPNSRVFMPEKYLRNNDIISRRFNLWSQKYYNFWNKIQSFYNADYNVLPKIINQYVNGLNNNILYNNYIYIQTKLNKIFINPKPNKISQLYLLINKHKYNFLSQKLMYTINQRINDLYPNISQTWHKKPKLLIDIKQGTSLISNLVFSTKKIAIINSRNLYHYYPFYTKKPYGTGIKQYLMKKNDKFNKFKMLISGQILKLNYISKYTLSTFNKIQQLSKWIPYNIYKYSYWNNQRYSLNILAARDKNIYLPYFYSNKVNKIFYRSHYQHLMPIYNNWQKFVKKLHVYYYLLYAQYNLQQISKLGIKNRHKWWVDSKKKVKIDDNYYAQFKKQWNLFFLNWNLTSILSRITWKKILKAKKQLWFNSKNKLTYSQQQEKNIYIQYHQELDNYKKQFNWFLNKLEKKKLFWKTKLIREIYKIKNKQRKLQQKKLTLGQKLQQKKLALALKIEQDKLALEHKLQQDKLALELKLQQEQLVQQKKMEKRRLRQQKEISDRKLIEVGLDVRLPKDVWASLTENLRVKYHMHQKTLRNDAKKVNESISSSVNNNNNTKK